MSKVPVVETLVDGFEWLRIADPAWGDPVDASFSKAVGGRWNPPDSWPTLYLNEDTVTARLNVQLFTADWPYEPEDLRPEHAPTLVSVTLPRSQAVRDAHSPAGVASVGLPATYPVDASGHLVPHEPCQSIGGDTHAAGLRGVRCRSATSPLGEGRELAWYPATTRSRARPVAVQSFSDWYWA